MIASVFPGVSGATLAAHRNVLAASSPVLNTLLKKNALLVDVPDINTVTWNRLLNFIYLGKVGSS